MIRIKDSSFKGGRFMKTKNFFAIFLVLGFVLGTHSMIMAQEANFKDYNVCIVQDLEVPSGSPAPESSGMQMAEKAIYQIKRYNEKYSLFDTIVKEGGKASKEVPSGKKVLIIKGEVKEYAPPTVGRRIGRSFIPGGEYTGTATFAARYKFIDKESGKVIYETDLRTSSTGSNDTVDYAMDRNGEALAKTITKLKGR
jgi:uncharacterized protein (DUF2147 family)